MSEYRHSVHKFADTGLQLRLPIDLVPMTQYSVLTNAVPRIEGEIIAREGMATVSRLYQTAAISVLSRVNTTVAVASIATTIYPHGFNIGNQVTLVVTANSPTATSTVVVGTYAVTITAVTTFGFTFTPGIAGAWNSTDTGTNVFAQATNQALSTNLTNTLVNTIYRLNQAQPAISSDRLVAMQGRLYKADLPAGNAFTEVVHPSVSFEPPRVANGFSGNPLSIISFRFSLDSVSWAIIADSSVMYKYRDDQSDVPLFFFLGNPVPSVPAQASAGAAGNLNSTGGALYDWRYTYYDGYVSTEGNPSPGVDSATVDIQNSSAQTTPVHAGQNAFTGVTNTSGTGTSNQADSAPFHDVSCIWKGFSNPATTPYAITINVTWQAEIVKTNSGPVQAILSYSVNGGSTFTPFSVITNVTSGTLNPTVVLPLGTDLTQVQIEALGFCNSDPGGGTGNSILITVTNIEIDCAHTPVSAAIAVVNKQADVLVATPTENDGRVTAIRLYRRGGSLPDAWRLVGTYNLSGLPVASIDKPAGAGVNDGSVSGTAVSWTNPNNVTSAVNFATVALSNAAPASKWLDVTGFGYGIVTGQPIRGIKVTMVAKASVASSTSYLVVTLLKAGTAVGAWDGFHGGAPPGSVKTSFGITLPTGNTTFTFGGPTDVWGTTWTAADINNANFGVHFLMYDPSGTVLTYSVNDVNVSVYTDMVQLIDNVSDVQLSTQPILQFDNDPPVTSTNVTNQPLSFIWGPVGIDARVLGCGDPGRPECVYYSKPGNPDAWPPENFLEVSDPGTPIIAGCTYNTRNYAFSREAIYELVEGLGTGSTFTPFKTPSAHGLYTPWGLAIGPAMYFVAKDGIYQSTGGQDFSLVENDIKPLFPTYESPGENVGIYEAVDYSDPNLFRLAYHNDELYFLYRGLRSGNPQILIYDILKKRWRAADYGQTHMGLFYSEPATVSSLLAGTTSGEVVHSGSGLDPDNSPISVQLTTGAHDMGMPLNRKQFGNVIFDIDPVGAPSPIQITPVVDGKTAKPVINVTGVAGRQQFPLDLSDFFGFNLEFNIQFSVTGTSPVLYQYDILWFPEPAGLTHWESQPSSMGIQGFLHVRDMYVAIRSTAPVTLSMTFDTGTGSETTQTYTIPSTGGERLKVYLQMDSNKGLLYRWALDSSQEFRVYVEDIEVRAKGWLTVLGYSVMKPFGAEVAA